MRSYILGFFYSFIMNKKIYIYSGILAIIASVICGFFDWRISTGIIIGVICSFMYFYVLNENFKIGEDGNISKGGVLGYFVRIGLIALPLLISCLFPKVFNIFGAFGGVMLFRIVMIITFFKENGGKLW